MVLLEKIEKTINNLYRSKQIDIVEATDRITSFIKPKQCQSLIRLNGSDTYFLSFRQTSCKWKIP
jgi:hypothetical protein